MERFDDGTELDLFGDAPLRLREYTGVTALNGLPADYEPDVIVVDDPDAVTEPAVAELYRTHDEFGDSGL